MLYDKSFISITVIVGSACSSTVMKQIKPLHYKQPEGVQCRNTFTRQSILKMSRNAFTIALHSICPLIFLTVLAVTDVAQCI